MNARERTHKSNSFERTSVTIDMKDISETHACYKKRYKDLDWAEEEEEEEKSDSKKGRNDKQIQQLACMIIMHINALSGTANKKNVITLNAFSRERTATIRRKCVCVLIRVCVSRNRMASEIKLAQSRPVRKEGGKVSHRFILSSELFNSCNLKKGIKKCSNFVRERNNDVR